MAITQTVRDILSHYESDNPGTKANLARILMAGRLGGTGKLVILPVDQGFEHGPARSFAANPVGYDPLYHHGLAIEAGLSAYASALGMLEASSGTFAGQIPTILKVNSSNSLATAKEAPSQAITGSVSDALRRGLKAVRVEASSDVRAKLAALAQTHGARLDEDDRPCLDLVDGLVEPVDLAARCRDWLMH